MIFWDLHKPRALLCTVKLAVILSHCGHIFDFRLNWFTDQLYNIVGGLKDQLRH